MALKHSVSTQVHFNLLTTLSKNVLSKNRLLQSTHLVGNHGNRSVRRGGGRAGPRTVAVVRVIEQVVVAGGAARTHFVVVAAEDRTHVVVSVKSSTEKRFIKLSVELLAAQCVVHSHIHAFTWTKIALG